MHTWTEMEEYPARCKLVVWVTSHLLGTTHEQLCTLCARLEVRISSWQMSCALTGQLPSLAGTDGQPHAPLQQLPHTNAWAPCRSALAGHWGALCAGLVSSGLNTTCASCMSLRSYCSPREPGFSTTRKLSHTRTFATASKASTPDVTSCYRHLIFVPQRLLVARGDKPLPFFDLLAHH